MRPDLALSPAASPAPAIAAFLFVAVLDLPLCRLAVAATHSAAIDGGVVATEADPGEDASSLTGGVWTTPTIADDVSSGHDWGVALGPDGLALYLSSRREGSLFDDIHVATRAWVGDPFSPPVVVPGVCDADPSVDDHLSTISDNGLRMYIGRSWGGIDRTCTWPNGRR